MSQESKSIHQAKNLVMEKLHFSNERANTFIRYELRNDIPVLKTKNGAKFILGTARMFCDNQFTDANIINDINSTLKLVSSDQHINEYDRNLNGLSAQEIIDRFALAGNTNLEKEKAEINQMVFEGDSDYEIVRIDSFEQAHTYSEYVDWCIVYSERMFKSYTAEGFNQFYFCLSKDYKIINNSINTNTSNSKPLDKYGLSMIAVSVNENGELNTCTCRWNHNHNGNDSIMDAVQISKVINRNFFETFKPNNIWKERIETIKRQLEAGEDIHNVFDLIREPHNLKDYRVVRFHGKCNLLRKSDNTIKFEYWFSNLPFGEEAFFPCPVSISHRQENYLTTDGELLLKENLPLTTIFIPTSSGQIAFVKLPNGRYQYIDINGQPLFDRTFQYASSFYGDKALIRENDKTNWINPEGKILSELWFDDCGIGEYFPKIIGHIKGDRLMPPKSFILDNDFHITPLEGEAKGIENIGLQTLLIVRRHDGLFNYYDANGQLLYKVWFQRKIAWGHFPQTLILLGEDNRFYRIMSNGHIMPIENISAYPEIERVFLRPKKPDVYDWSDFDIGIF